jgi:hypothetical protein
MKTSILIGAFASLLVLFLGCGRSEKGEGQGKPLKQSAGTDVQLTNHATFGQAADDFTNLSLTKPVPTTNSLSENSPQSSSNIEATHQMNTNGDNAEILSAFKADEMGLRRFQVARKVVPLIRTGISQKEVEDLLGSPSGTLNNGQTWHYVLFYSAYLDVRFTTNGTVEKVEVVGVD